MAKYKKGEYRDQFVIAYITDFEDYKDIVFWAKKFAIMLKKGLILLHISDEKYTNISTSEASKHLEQINKEIDIPYTHSFVALKGESKNIIYSTGELLNGVMLVSKVDNLSKSKNNPISVKNIIKNFYQSRIAYFLFASKGRQNNDFKEVVLSMDALKESKEKILWASYFGRFANSIVDIYYHRYRDEYLQKQLNLNIGFARKMFKNFNIETRNIHSLNRKTHTDIQSLDFAERENKDLCIFQTTANKGIIEFFFGLGEKKVLEKLDKVPVLFLNRR
ncbi:MAG: hypothetical protein Q4Q06_06915, partial [Bacteroidota bacterium]|nr:hypothetical protein [Bacteroidota bacterium]